MKERPATYTLPQEILEELNALVEPEKLSQFVAEATQKRLEEDYQAAAQNSSRNREIEEWSAL